MKTMEIERREIKIPINEIELRGDLTIPDDCTGLVIFAHGSGSGRKSPRNQFVARLLNDEGLGTLLFDLLTEEEERLEERTRHLRFDIPMLSVRLAQVAVEASEWDNTNDFPQGFFGASTGAAAALIASTMNGVSVRAVVSRGGRPDLAGATLPQVTAPTLLIVGGDDIAVIGLNKQAFDQMECEKDLRIIPGASHLFEEPGTLEEAGKMAADWFVQHLAAAS
jgi:putative phosphoribosyl transferase